MNYKFVRSGEKIEVKQTLEESLVEPLESLPDYLRR